MWRRDTGRNGKGAVLVWCLYRLSSVRLNWVCLGYKIQVMAEALARVRGEGFEVGVRHKERVIAPVETCTDPFAPGALFLFSF